MVKKLNYLIYNIFLLSMHKLSIFDDYFMLWRMCNIKFELKFQITNRDSFPRTRELNGQFTIPLDVNIYIKLKSIYTSYTRKPHL